MHLYSVETFFSAIQKTSAGQRELDRDTLYFVINHTEYIIWK